MIPNKYSHFFFFQRQQSNLITGRSAGSAGDHTYSVVKFGACLILRWPQVLQLPLKKVHPENNDWRTDQSGKHDFTMLLSAMICQLLILAEPILQRFPQTQNYSFLSWKGSGVSCTIRRSAAHRTYMVDSCRLVDSNYLYRYCSIVGIVYQVP